MRGERQRRRDERVDRWGLGVGFILGVVVGLALAALAWNLGLLG